MVNKKGQVTIFIVIAVLLVVAIGIIFVVRNSLKPGETTPPAGTENIQGFVEQCLKNTAEDGIIFIGRQGGYYAPPSSISYTGNDSDSDKKYFTELGNINVSYYSSTDMPTLATIEEELSNYVEGNINKCLNDFSIFKQKGFEVQNGTMSVSVRILDEKVVVFLDYPVTITKGDFTQQKTVYSVDVPIRLGLIYTLTQTIIQSGCQLVWINNLVELSLYDSCFTPLSRDEYNFRKSMLIYPGNTVLFVITDPEYKLNNTYYDFIFAYKYA